ncbi:lipase/acyltransferase domain-containing protein [Archangium sp.]|uniref:lipase/acyltransferase domain-containing protein n=1 Tax=Archangium sp. TaxID=1872627 RepID=UPI002D6B0C35|nr:hypothetical protein [Archangium sp.]HYO51674.1 hypothetical protein [Archangium sp.]
MIFGKDLADLYIQRGSLRDAGNRIVRACGALEIELGPVHVSPYDRTEKFFRTGALANYVVFAFDWRRDVRESARLLQGFLEELGARAPGAPARTTLLGHSMGGLVGKAFLSMVLENQPEQASRYFSRFISVGTPFFGTANHHVRYYEGESALAPLIPDGKRRMAELVASAPGLGCLLPMDLETYQQAGQALGIPVYPVRDQDSGAEVDPRDPAQLERYPVWVDPFADQLVESRSVQHLMARPLPGSLASRCFHLYTTKVPTAHRFSWGRLEDRAKYHPNHHRPPLRYWNGDGDGTVPVWSASLLGTPPENIRPLAQAKSHGGLLEHPEVLSAIWSIVRQDLPEAMRHTFDDRATQSLQRVRSWFNRMVEEAAPRPKSFLELDAGVRFGEAGELGAKKLVYELIL